MDRWIKETLEERAADVSLAPGSWHRLAATLTATGVAKPRRRFQLGSALEAIVAAAVLILVVGLSTIRNQALIAPTTQEAGTRVAYVREGALWVQDLPGGKARQVFGGHVSHPRWSPSGKWLLAQTETGFRTIPAKGSGESRAIAGVGAVWSPQNDLVAYSDQAGNLRVLDVSTNRERVLVEGSKAGRTGAPTWSPDGRWLAFQGSEGDERAGIWRVPVSGGAPLQVLSLEGEEARCLILAGWSADGEALLYWPVALCSQSLLADGAPLMAVPIQGGSPQMIVGRMLAHPESLANSSTTDQIAVAAGGDRMTWHGKWIDLVDPAAGAERRISPPDQAAISPTWSPDGKAIAYVAMPDLGPEVGGGEPARKGMMERRLWLASPDGKEVEQITRDPGYRDEAPHWTADGLLFARLDPENKASLWTISLGSDGKPLADGATAQRVTEMDAPPDAWFGYYGWLNWSSVFDVYDR